VGAGISNATYEGTSSYDRSVFVAPGFDTFVGAGISLGVSTGFEYRETRFLRTPTLNSPGVTGESTRFGFALAPRMGVAIPLGDSFTFYPRVSLAFGYSDIDVRAGFVDRIAYETYSWNLGVYAPVLFHFAPYAFAGFGPYAGYDIVSQVTSGGRELDPNPATTLGARFVLGVWW
jgi:hypothetical protein